MRRLGVLVVEDEAEVRDALVRDLAPFAAITRIEAAQSADDAREAIAYLDAAGCPLALVLADHRMPGQSGVAFLVDLHADPVTRAARKVLVTGQAGLADTVRAVNEAGLDHYIAKPWTPEELTAVVRAQLTEFVLAEVDDVLPYVAVLDGPRLLEAARDRFADR